MLCSNQLLGAEAAFQRMNLDITTLAFQWKATPWENRAVEPLGLLQAQGKDSVQSPWTTRVPRADPPP